MKKLQRLILFCALIAVVSVAASVSVQPSQTSSVGSSSALQGTQNSESEELLQSARALYRQQKFDEALAKCAKALTLSPNDLRGHVLMGAIYWAQGKLKSASEAYARAIILRPRSKEIYLAKAQVDHLRNAHEEALAAARKATEVAPDYAEAYAMVGNLLRFDKELRAEAITALRTAIKLGPKLRRPYDDLGEILADADDAKGAEEVFRQGMAADPEHMAGRFTLGRLLVKQDRLAEARELWEGRTSDEDRTYPQFIELLKRAESFKKATDALAQKPHDPDALVDMGMAVMEGDSWVVDGRQKRALVYFQEALKLNPKFARAQYGVVKAYIQGVNFNKNESKIVAVELAKLKQLDPKLGDEMEEYRKKYVGGIIGSPTKLDQ